MTVDEYREAIEEVEWIISEYKHKRYWRERPVKIKDFICEPMFLWLWDTAYDSVIEDCTNVVEKWVWEAVFLEWIGSWKSFKAQILTLYKTYELLCMENPFKFFMLPEEKPFVCVNMWLSQAQAKWVVFKGMKSLLTWSKYFSSFNPAVMETMIKFYAPRNPDVEMITVMSGSSQETWVLGHNVYCSVMDEVSFMFNSDERSSAEDIYWQLKRRQKSRFWNKWLLCLISSPKSDIDFAVTHYKEVEWDENIYRNSRPTRLAKNRDRMDREVFVFNYDTMRIVSEDENWFSDWVLVKPTEIQKNNLKFGDERDWYLRIIPKDFYDEFSKSPEAATRDLWARPCWVLEAFFRIPSDIDRAMSKGTLNRVSNLWVRDVSNPVLEQVYIHIDIWLNRKNGNGHWDYAGIAVCHCAWFDAENDNRPIIVYDFVERVWAWESGEVRIEDLRRRVISLFDNGWRIGRVTLDTFQSYDTVQILNSKGIFTENLSVDTTPAPYEALREWLRTNDVYLPEFPALAKELKELQRVKWAKVDHPAKWSKDIADAVAWAYYSCITDQSDAYAVNTTTKISIRK